MPVIRNIAGTTADDAEMLTEAARALNAGDAARARELTESVIARNPVDLQAPYLLRIAEREQARQIAAPGGSPADQVR
jgi:hypothetical protein